MAATEGQIRLLDQLQREVNRLLEQIGRVFAALASKDSKHRSLAQASRLKHTLPDNVHRFHEALDRLESDLQLAKLVTRRDLAICLSRTAGGIEIFEEINLATHSEVQEPMDLGSQTEPARQTLAGDREADDLGGERRPHDDAPSSADKSPGLDMRSVERASISGASQQQDGAKSPDVARMALALGSDNVEQTAPPNPEPTTSKPDTEEKDNDIPPDTAISNNADLESLFGPASASGAPIVDELEIHGDGTESFNFNFAEDEAEGGIDGMAHDSMETFLPGLQDYANAEPGEGGNSTGLELDALLSGFAAGSEANKSHADQQEAGGGGAANFDDLLDFEDLGTGFGSSAEDGGNGEFNFDFS